MHLHPVYALLFVLYPAVRHIRAVCTSSCNAFDEGFCSRTPSLVNFFLDEMSKQVIPLGELPIPEQTSSEKRAHEGRFQKHSPKEEPALFRHFFLGSCEAAQGF